MNLENLENAAIDILVGRESTTINLYDRKSALQLLTITLTPQQLSSALSRLSMTPCEAEINHDAISKTNKKLEVSRIDFELPADMPTHNNDDSVYDIAVKHAPEDWKVDNYFGSQGSFYTDGDKKMARATIRRWV